MNEATKAFLQISEDFTGITASSMFGAQCIKTNANGKGAIMLWKDALVFKLNPDQLNSHLQLPGVCIFEPAEGRKMNGWLLVPSSHQAIWLGLAADAINYVSSLPSQDKPKAKIKTDKATGITRKTSKATPHPKNER